MHFMIYFELPMAIPVIKFQVRGQKISKVQRKPWYIYTKVFFKIYAYILKLNDGMILRDAKFDLQHQILNYFNIKHVLKEKDFLLKLAQNLQAHLYSISKLIKEPFETFYLYKRLLDFVSPKVKLSNRFCHNYHAHTQYLVRHYQQGSSDKA